MNPISPLGDRVPARLSNEALNTITHEIARGARVLHRRLLLLYRMRTPMSFIEHEQTYNQWCIQQAYDEKVVGGWTRLKDDHWQALHVLDVARVRATLRCAVGIEFTDIRCAAGFASEVLRDLCHGVRRDDATLWRRCIGLASDALYAVARNDRVSPRGERNIGLHLVEYCDDADAAIRAVSEVARTALAGCGRLDSAFTCERDDARLRNAWRLVEPVVRIGAPAGTFA